MAFVNLGTLMQCYPLEFQPEGQPFNLTLTSEITGETCVGGERKEAKLTNSNPSKREANLIAFDCFSFNNRVKT